MTMLLAQGHWWCPGCGYGMGGWTMLFMGLFWIVVIAVTIGVLARFTGFADRRRATPGAASDAEGILRERYARGEIDEAAYRHMLDELRR